MKEYKIGVVPGPTSVPPEILQIYSRNFGSADLEDDFIETYVKTTIQLQEILHARESSVIIQNGEGMVALWGALKSICKQGDKVLAIGTGVYGYGIGEMAKSIGAEVEYVSFEYDEIASDFNKIREAAVKFRPLLITAVHCETPSGTLNPVKEIGSIAKEVGAFYYVDFVSSGCGVEVNVEESHIDLGLLGSQKAISILPDLSIITISKPAWKRIEEVNYIGYDAILPFRDAVKTKYFPYTHNWHSIEALHESLSMMLKEGMQNVYKRHEEVANYCRKRIQEMGLKLFPKEGNSPTVTAVCVPENWTWEEFDKALRSHGMVVAGSYGKLSGKIFRIGHMGYQANFPLIKQALDVLELVLKEKK